MSGVQWQNEELLTWTEDKGISYFEKLIMENRKSAQQLTPESSFGKRPKLEPLISEIRTSNDPAISIL
jgi:hypothetical protein